MNRLMIGIAGAALTVGVVRGQETKIATAFVRTPLESRTIKGAPYSAEYSNDVVQTLADGNRIVHHSTGRVYRDSEGRVRREEDRQNGAPAISITDPVAGVSYSLNPETHVAAKTPAFAGTVILNKIEELRTTIEARAGGGGWETRSVEPGTVVIPDGAGVVEFNGGRFSVRRSNDNEKRAEETLPSKIIEGVLADGKRTTTTIAAGAIGNEREITVTVEEWTSPELHVLVLTEHKDPRTGDSTYKLTNINRSDPPASLFEVPSDYTIRDTGIRRFDRQ
ncbi:MAG TPA: hypothetical protein VIW45_21230 [Vicinamibacterales bacterium]|jgi:hypothetical protein